MIPRVLITLLVLAVLAPPITVSYSPSLFQTLCINPPPNTCDFYLDCLESRYRCSSNGYPLGYGYKYCSKFKNSASGFSKQGQKWIIKTMTCLQQYLISD